MSEPNYCPECREVWVPGRKKCDCGHRLDTRAADYDPDHGRCAFRGQQRCPLPGVISETTRADNGTPFYCRFHAATHGDPRMGAQVLDAIVRGELRIERTDWRDAAIAAVLSRRNQREAA